MRSLEQDLSLVLHRHDTCAARVSRPKDPPQGSSLAPGARTGCKKGGDPQQGGGGEHGGKGGVKGGAGKEAKGGKGGLQPADQRPASAAGAGGKGGGGGGGGGGGKEGGGGGGKKDEKEKEGKAQKLFKKIESTQPKPTAISNPFMLLEANDD